MKKFIVILFILVTSNNYSNANIIETIENEKKQCINTNYLNDYFMSQCNYKAIEKYDKEIDEIIKKQKLLLCLIIYTITPNEKGI